MWSVSVVGEWSPALPTRAMGTWLRVVQGSPGDRGQATVNHVILTCANVLWARGGSTHFFALTSRVTGLKEHGKHVMVSGS